MQHFLVLLIVIVSEEFALNLGEFGTLFCRGLRHIEYFASDNDYQICFCLFPLVSSRQMEQAVTVLGSQPRIRFGLTGWLRLLGLSEATQGFNQG